VFRTTTQLLLFHYTANRKCCTTSGKRGACAVRARLSLCGGRQQHTASTWPLYAVSAEQRADVTSVMRRLYIAAAAAAGTPPHLPST